MDCRVRAVQTARIRLHAVSCAFAPAAEESQQKNSKVQGQRPVSDIVQIVLEAVFDTGIPAPSVNLSVTRKSGANGVAQVILSKFAPKFLDEVGTLGTGADETHFSPQDVPELRKFIKPASAQPRAGSRTSRIIWNGPHGAEVAFGADAHCSEFIDPEGYSVQPNASLGVQHRSGIS